MKADMTLELADRTLLREAALIDGEWLSAGADGIAVIDPATGDPVGTVPG